MSKIQDHWPEWRSEIANTRRLVEHVMSKPATPETEEDDAILAGINTLLKAVFWLLERAESDT